jgi:transcriptional regulatory protein LEU3
MEREISELRTRLAEMSGHAPSIGTPGAFISNSLQDPASYPGFTNEDDQYLGTHGAVQSLLDLRGGSPSNAKLYSLGNVILASDSVNELFKEYFENYHPWLPFLDADVSPEEYLKQDRLLFWTIICVAARHYVPDRSLYSKLTGAAGPLNNLLWETLRKVPQSQYVVKALCLLCTWPLPTSRTSTEQTYMLCGLMMQIALQIGLHQPTHLQDFSRVKLTIRREDINDRVRTWAVCNIVAQT